MIDSNGDEIAFLILERIIMCVPYYFNGYRHYGFYSINLQGFTFTLYLLHYECFLHVNDK